MNCFNWWKWYYSNSSILKVQVTSVDDVSDIWPSTWACEHGLRKDMRNGKCRDNQGAYGVAKVECVLKGSQDAERKEVARKVRWQSGKSIVVMWKWLVTWRFHNVSSIFKKKIVCASEKMHRWKGFRQQRSKSTTVLPQDLISGHFTVSIANTTVTSESACAEHEE